MTYEFFKKEIKKLGLKFIINDNSIIVANESDTVCYVEKHRRYDFYFYCEFYFLEESLQQKLFRLVVGLARTSITNREEPHTKKRWYLKHKYLNKWGNNYLQKDLFNDLSLDKKKYDFITQCTFTKDEIEELKKRINLNDFEMKEVE